MSPERHQQNLRGWRDTFQCSHPKTLWFCHENQRRGKVQHVVPSSPETDFNMYLSKTSAQLHHTLASASRKQVLLYDTYTMRPASVCQIQTLSSLIKSHCIVAYQTKTPSSPGHHNWLQLLSSKFDDALVPAAKREYGIFR